MGTAGAGCGYYDGDDDCAAAEALRPRDVTLARWRSTILR
jgi:hypothetical protein